MGWTRPTLKRLARPSDHIMLAMRSAMRSLGLVREQIPLGVTITIRTTGGQA